MRRECRERFPCHGLQRKPLVSDPGMHHGTCMSGSLTRGGGKKRAWYSRRMRNPQLYASGKRSIGVTCYLTKETTLDINQSMRHVAIVNISAIPIPVLDYLIITMNYLMVLGNIIRVSVYCYNSLLDFALRIPRLTWPGDIVVNIFISYIVTNIITEWSNVSNSTKRWFICVCPDKSKSWEHTHLIFHI